MHAIALKMLLGDRAKYLGLVFGIMFSTLLMSQQVSIFIGIMARTASQVVDVAEADLWVMDPKVQYIDEVRPMPDKDLVRVRGVPGVEWALPYYKGLTVVRAEAGRMQQVMLMGVDDGTLAGGPPRMLMGNWEDLRRPNAIVMDKVGYKILWPGEELRLGRLLEMNDRRAEIVGICDTSPPFMTFPIIYTRLSEATLLMPSQRARMSFVIAHSKAGEAPETVARRITAQTGLQALTSEEFQWRSINYYLQRTGIAINFGITVLLGFIVGAAIAGQTFYIFVMENLRQFGALKAIGVTNRQILRMILLQALLVGFVGYGIGIGAAALFFQGVSHVPAMRGVGLIWQVMAGSAAAVALIMGVASLVSIRKLVKLDPAIVFRG